MENDWEAVRSDRGWSGGTGMGILRITLLFGSAAVALALIIAPIADSQTRSYAAEDRAPFLDDISTGSVGRTNIRNVYTIHKSVLQSSPDAVCVIHADGRRQGEC
jgi:hypothetical protein